MLVLNTAQNKSNGSRPRRTVQSLGGHTYAIPEATVTKGSLMNKMVFILCIAFFPLLMALLIVYTGVMMVAPVSWRHAILARLIPPQMTCIKRMTENQRKLLLQHVSGRVLDVGAGAGAYMSFLQKKAAHVVALEPVAALHPLIQEEAKKAGFEDYQITISTDHVEAFAEANPTLAASFDWIILGNVLCEVTDAQSTLDTVHALLKEGGHVYFSEHVGSPSNTLARTIQNLINPWWRRASGGCNRNRDSLYTIEGMADWDVISWEMSTIKLPMTGSFVMGLAQKAAV